MKKIIFFLGSVLFLIFGIFLGIQIKDSNIAFANILFSEQSETITAIERAKKSVVSIIRTEELTSVITDQLSGKTTIDAETQQVSGGSGILVSENGVILTNKHVIQAEGKYSVILDNGKIYDAKIITKDPLEDLALIKIEGKDLPYAKLGNSRELQIGQTVLAIGYSLGRYKNSVTKGIISGLNRNLPVENITLSNIIQTDAAINKGNSGGALINLRGEVIGVNTAVELSGENVGFAIPINSARKSIVSYKKYNKIIRPKLGVRYSMINPSIAKFSGLSRKSGALIHEGNGPEEPAVLPDSPAFFAGLKENDIIFEVNAIAVNEDHPLSEIINYYDHGQEIGFKVQRGNKIIILKVILDKFE